jgi:hypothetical protein
LWFETSPGKKLWTPPFDQQAGYSDVLHAPSYQAGMARRLIIQDQPQATMPHPTHKTAKVTKGLGALVNGRVPAYLPTEFKPNYHQK